MKKILLFTLILSFFIFGIFSKDVGSDTFTLTYHSTGYTKTAFTDEDISNSSDFVLINKPDKTVSSNESLSFYASVISTNDSNLNVSLILPNVMYCNDESITDTIPLIYTSVPGIAVNGNESERILTLESGSSVLRYSGKIDMTIGDTSNVSQGEYSAVLTIIVSSI